MCSLRLLQNECIVFVPPGVYRVGSVVWGSCFGLVFQKCLPGSPKTAWEPFWEPWAPGAAKGSKQALKTGSERAATSCDSESRFSGLLEPLWVLRQQMCSLRSLQNECIVFVPPGACRVGSVVWGSCFGLVFPDRAVFACHPLLGFQDHIVTWCGLKRPTWT